MVRVFLGSQAFLGLMKCAPSPVDIGWAPRVGRMGGMMVDLVVVQNRKMDLGVQDVQKSAEALYLAGSPYTLSRG